MNVSARLMDTFQGGLLTIQKLRTGNNQTVTVQHVSITGGQTVITGGSAVSKGSLPEALFRTDVAAYATAAMR